MGARVTAKPATRLHVRHIVRRICRERRHGRCLNLDLMLEKEEGRTLPDEASPQRCSRGNVLGRALGTCALDDRNSACPE